MFSGFVESIGASRTIALFISSSSRSRDAGVLLVSLAFSPVGTMTGDLSICNYYLGDDQIDNGMIACL